jgi:hypothetical protein
MNNRLKQSLIKSRILHEIKPPTGLSESWTTFSNTIEDLIIEGYLWTTLDYFHDKSSLDVIYIPRLVKHAQSNDILSLEFRVSCLNCGYGFLRLDSTTIEMVKKNAVVFLNCPECGYETHAKQHNLIYDLFFNIALFADIVQPKIMPTVTNSLGKLHEGEKIS